MDRQPSRSPIPPPIGPPAFTVGKVPVYGEAILAPMDGFSDWPFRSICRELGSAMSYTEFVKAEYVLRGLQHVRARLTYDEAERPVVFQVYGDDPSLLLKAALKLQELSPDVIDVNMGCPARSVASRGAGVGLMLTPLKVAHIFRKLSAALEVPVSGKIRLGWRNYRSGRLIARVAEENGAALIAVHGRMREQRYDSPADWDAIAEVRAALSIPVIGNGDVRTVADIARMKAHTGCQAVMIGRAAIANPWIFSGLNREQVPPERVRQLLHLHLERNVQFYGRENGERLFRKNAVQVLGLARLSREDRTAILRQHPTGEFQALLDEMAAAL